MQNSFAQIIEILDNLELICGEMPVMPPIERDAVLERLRHIYVELQTKKPVQEASSEPETAVETPVPAAPQVPEPEPQAQEEPREYAVHPGLKEDVDLFFDTEHESYQPNEDEPVDVQIVDDVEEDVPQPEKVMPQPEEKLTEPEKEMPKPEAKPVQSEATAPQPEEEKVVTEPARPSIAERVPTSKPKRDDQIEPESLFSNEEDDLLQFIPRPKRHEQPEPAPKAPVAQPAPAAPSKPEPAIPAQSAKPAEKPSVSTAAPQRSLNDLFNEQKEDRSLSAQFQHAKVHDLTKAISINDKFTFIKELFQNRGEEFSAAIQKLNQCANLEAAFDCLENYKKQYFWDSTSTAYLALCDLLRRKFM